MLDKSLYEFKVFCVVWVIDVPNELVFSLLLVSCEVETLLEFMSLPVNWVVFIDDELPVVCVSLMPWVVKLNAEFLYVVLEVSMLEPFSKILMVLLTLSKL